MRKFRYGAYIYIAKQVGCSSEYVRSVLRGRRAGRSAKAKLILKAAESLQTEQHITPNENKTDPLTTITNDASDKPL